MTSDEGLYRSFLGGDEESLTHLMERFGDALTLYVYGYLQNLEDAEDIMIETFSYLVVKRPSIRDQGLKSYLYKTARHMALRTKEKRRRAFSFALEEFQHLSEEQYQVDTIVLSKEKYQLLHMCMAELSSDYRESIYLVYFEGMSHKEAAQVMKKRERQVSDLIFRGKKSLKTKLEREGIIHA